MVKTTLDARSVSTKLAPLASAEADQATHGVNFTTDLESRSIQKTTLSPSPSLSRRSLPIGTDRTSASRTATTLSPMTLPVPISQQMQISGLNHFNITASPRLIEQVKRFYTGVIGLTVGPRAHLDHEGYWLYAGEVPLLHLSTRQEMETTAMHCKGHFNHISLSCVGLASAIAKMVTTGTPYRIIQLDDIHQTQIFLTDPAGISVELTFLDEYL
ncbi:MAG: hypothetical protein WBD47_22445 [Phormidesmis sp.]